MQFLKYALAAFSIGSAIAAPAVEPVAREVAVGATVGGNSLADVQVLVGHVADIKVTVLGEVDNLNKIAGGNPTDADVPTIKASLSLIRQKILDIEVDLNPLVKGVVQPLLEADLHIVLDLVTDVEALLQGVEDTVNNLLKTLPAELQKQLQHDLTYVLQVLNPVLSPVLDLVAGLLGTNKGAIVDQINGIVVNLNGLLGGLLNPLLGTLAKIL
ncbi:hypothetical protein SLS62_001592 [Diatrype stigma]|uniref:Uncharacterized protein n=1 Tax=Diatrype stigma TaxID=117547 RepID=A0AAN9YT92_9PEZI